jgi:hypothetical protein
MDTGGSFPGVKRPGREVDHSRLTSVESQENVDLYTHSPIRVHGVSETTLRDVHLIKQRDAGFEVLTAV